MDELPDDVIEAIRAHRKIEAIERLREHSGLGLKESRQAVEAYLRDHPETTARVRPPGDSGVGRVALAAVIAILLYLVYRYFTQEG